MKNLAANLNNIEKVSCNVSLAPGMVEAVELDGKELIVIRVPKAKASQKPVYLNRNASKAYFRQNESDIACPESMLQQMLRDKSDESPLSRMLPDTSFREIDSKTWSEYRTVMKYTKLNNAWVRLDDVTLLEKLGGYARNIKTGEEGLTLAGLLMFGTDDAIRKYFPRYQINYYAYDGTERTSVLRRWSDRITVDGTWEPNLFQFFYRVLPLISEPLRTPFKLNPDMITAQGESTAHVAVREALANAIVHADYFGVGGIDIRKYPDRLELSNPGTLLVPKALIYKGGMSCCRNGALQAMFQNIGLVDKAGSGIDKILTGWLDQCLIPPSVEEETAGISRVTWTLPYVGMLPKSHEAELMRIFGERRYDSLDAVRRNILLIVQDKGTSAHKDIHQFLPFIHPVDLTRILSSLVQSGFLRSEGRASATRYSIGVGSAIDAERSSTLITRSSTSIESDETKEKTPQVTGSQLKEGRMQERSALSGSAVSGAIDAERSSTLITQNSASTVAEFSADLLAKIEQYRRRTRNTPEETDRIILEICQGRWFTLPQLAQLLDRSVAYIRNKSLQALVRHDKLRRKYDSPTHSDQAYTTVE